MKKAQYLVIYFILILFTSSSCAQPESKLENEHYPYWEQKASLFKRLPNTKNEIVFLGDSITDGCNWTELLQDLRIKNRGISGDTTDGILDRLDEITESNPLKIFLMIGINDLADGKSIEYTTNNIKRIIKTINKNSPETQIYIESILPVNSDFGQFKNHTNKTTEIILINNALQKYARAQGITYIDLFSLFATKENKLNPEYTNEGLHLTGAGYLLWKSAIEKFINL